MSFSSRSSGGTSLVSKQNPQGFILVNDHTNNMVGVIDSIAMHLPKIIRKYNSDTEQQYFLCESMWRVKRIIAPYAQMVEFQTMLWGIALQWYMKFIQTNRQGAIKTLDEVKIRLVVEFQRSNL